MAKFSHKKKAPNPISKQLMQDIEQLLKQKYEEFLSKNEKIAIMATTGDNASFLEASVGSKSCFTLKTKMQKQNNGRLHHSSSSTLFTF